MKSTHLSAAAVALFALAGQIPEVIAQATSAAESGCMVAVNNNYGGNVNNLTVVHSEFSQAASEVVIDADGERWRCLASNDGEVEDLSIIEGAAAGRSDPESPAESACMVAVNANYGGKVDTLTIVTSDFSQAGTEVIIDADGERWRCLASNDGKVEDLSVQE